MTTTIEPDAQVERAAGPGWRSSAVPVLLLYVVSRIVTTGIFASILLVARPGSRIGKHANLLDIATAWDGQWYWLIGTHGYPTVLPTAHTGVLQNAWAFLPLYPWLAGVLSFGQQALWPVAAVAVSVVSGAVAAVLLAALVRPHVGDRGAVITAVLFEFSPMAFLFQTAYAEALGLAVLFGVLILVDRRRYLAAIPLVLVLAFIRPGLQAVALVVLLNQGIRLLRARRAGLRAPIAETVRAVVLAAAAGVAGLLWPWIAGAVTGVPDAYIRTEVVWRTSWTGTATFVPVASWFYGADFWFGATSGPIVLGVTALAWTAILLTAPARRAGRTVRTWSVAWTVYLLAVFFPQSSVFRLLMPLAPIGAVFARTSTRVVVGVVVVSVALQGIWAFFLYGYWTHYWTVP
ncbi:hypothetical protein [Amnibacterium kyonggiense]